jgi:hypothetical protein
LSRLHNEYYVNVQSVTHLQREYELFKEEEIRVVMDNGKEQIRAHKTKLSKLIKSKLEMEKAKCGYFEIVMDNGIDRGQIREHTMKLRNGRNWISFIHQWPADGL